MFKILMRVLLGLIVVAMAAYIYVLKMPGMSVENRASDITIEASILYEEFTQDENAANIKYLNKIVQVTGLIDEVYEEEGHDVVILKNSDDELTTVITLEDGQHDQTKKYKTNKPITVKGVCTGMLMEVNITKGIIVED